MALGFCWLALTVGVNLKELLEVRISKL